MFFKCALDSFESGLESTIADTPYHALIVRVQGKLVNETKCLQCETVTSREEAFYDLSLEIEQNSSVTSCLQNFRYSNATCGMLPSSAECSLVAAQALRNGAIVMWPLWPGSAALVGCLCLAQHITVPDMLFYGCSSTETLDAEDKFFCDTCQCLQEAQKRMKVCGLAVVSLRMLSASSWLVVLPCMPKSSALVCWQMKIVSLALHHFSEWPAALS